MPSALFGICQYLRAVSRFSCECVSMFAISNSPFNALVNSIDPTLFTFISNFNLFSFRTARVIFTHPIDISSCETKCAGNCKSYFCLSSNFAEFHISGDYGEFINPLFLLLLYSYNKNEAFKKRKWHNARAESRTRVTSSLCSWLPASAFNAGGAEPFLVVLLGNEIY